MRLRRRRDESVTHIEGRGLVRQRVDQEPTDTQNLARGARALDGIAEQCNTESAPLPGLIDRQAPQDGHRHRVRHVAPDALGGLAQRQCTRGQAVIADDGPLRRDDVGPRSPAELIVPGAARKPVVEGLDTATKAFDVMRLRERRGGLEGYAFQGLGAAMRRS